MEFVNNIKKFVNKLHQHDGTSCKITPSGFKTRLISLNNKFFSSTCGITWEDKITSNELDSNGNSLFLILIIGKNWSGQG